MNIAADQPLANRPLFAGTDIDEGREMLSQLFTEVTLEPYAGNRFSTVINGVALTRSTVCYIKHPEGMITSTHAPVDFHTIQLPLTGAAEFHIDGQPVQADTEHGVVLSAGEQVSLETLPGNGMLCFIVDRGVIRDMVTAVTGRADLPVIRFAPQFDPAEPRTASLLSFLKNFTNELNRSGGILESPAAVASFEHTLATFMLFGLDHNLSDILNAPARDAGTDQVRLVEKYIAAHASEPINMEIIARETGHSANSIFRAFRKHRGYTPMQFLRSVRLKMVRQRLLLSQTPGLIINIAFECGFTHLGRFSVAYKRCYGESPSDTVRRAIRRRT